MTMYDRTVEGSERRLGVGWKFPDILALGRWANPAVGGIGALVLGGYLLTADPVTPPAPAAAPASAVQMGPSAPAPAQRALSSDTAIVPNSSAAHDESTRTSAIDLLTAVFGAVLALTWVIIGAWLGVRRARAPTPVHEPAYEGSSTTDPMTGNAYASPRGPTCQRMYDETRLVPQYLRCAEFPAMKQDLLQLAEVYTDEGRTLRRLEGVPDRRYSSLHDLIAEFRLE
jgi:hypothetical protein